MGPRSGGGSVAAACRFGRKSGYQAALEGMGRTTNPEGHLDRWFRIGCSGRANQEALTG